MPDLLPPETGWPGVAAFVTALGALTATLLKRQPKRGLVAHLESQVNAGILKTAILETRYDDIERRLDRIEAKLDVVLGHRS